MNGKAFSLSLEATEEKNLQNSSLIDFLSLTSSLSILKVFVDDLQDTGLVGKISLMVFHSEAGLIRFSSNFVRK